MQGSWMQESISICSCCWLQSMHGCSYYYDIFKYLSSFISLLMLLFALNLIWLCYLLWLPLCWLRLWLWLWLLWIVRWIGWNVIPIPKILIHVDGRVWTSVFTIINDVLLLFRRRLLVGVALELRFRSVFLLRLILLLFRSLFLSLFLLLFLGALFHILWFIILYIFIITQTYHPNLSNANSLSLSYSILYNLNNIANFLHCSNPLIATHHPLRNGINHNVIEVPHRL